MDGCNVLPETQFVGTRLRVGTTWVLFVGGFLPPCGAAGERSEFNIKPRFGAPLLIFPRGYLLKSFPQVDISARQQGFEIRVFPLLGELPKAIEPHLPVCQLYRWQHDPNMWSSPTTKSLDPIVVAALRVGFPGESHGPATCGFACNCPEPEAWTTAASGQPKHQHLPKYTKTYPNTHTYQNTPTPTQAHPCLPNLAHTYPSTPTPTQAHPHLPKHTHTYPSTPTPTQAHPWAPMPIQRRPHLIMELKDIHS